MRQKSRVSELGAGRGCTSWDGGRNPKPRNTLNVISRVLGIGHQRKELKRGDNEKCSKRKAIPRVSTIQQSHVLLFCDCVEFTSACRSREHTGVSDFEQAKRARLELVGRKALARGKLENAG